MKARNYSRLPIHLEATITYNDKIVEGELDNISLKGVFVKTGQNIPENDSVLITIYHHSKENKICQMRAKVVRKTTEGIALELEKTFLDCDRKTSVS